MINNKETYENKFVYRLVKVAYVIAFLILGAYIAIFSWISKPYKYTDDNKSFITCLSKNKTYTYSAVDSYLRKLPNYYDLGLNNQQDKAQYLCEAMIENDLKFRKGTIGITTEFFDDSEVFSEADQKWFPNTQENRKIIVGNEKNKFQSGIYKINDIYTTRGSWVNVILWWVIGIPIVYIVLNLCKETLLYILLAKRFEWDWLIKIIALFSSDNKN